MALVLTLSAVDVSNYIAYGSVSVKLNTLDFALIDAPNFWTTGNAVALHSTTGDFPDWNGTTTQVVAADIVDLSNGHQVQTISATNTQAAVAASAPFGLSDTPSSGLFEKEDGSGHIILEDGLGGAYLTEGSTYSYQGLSISRQLAPDTSVMTVGNLRTFARGLWPGQTVKVDSTNLNGDLIAGHLYTIQSITVTYQGANSPAPTYAIQFGDLITSLAAWAFFNGH